MISGRSSDPSDREQAAKQAIDDAVATLRSLAEETTSRQFRRPPPEPPLERPFAEERLSREEPSLPDATLLVRIREGFHRLGVVLAAACAGIALLVSTDAAQGHFDLRRTVPLLAGAAAVYPLCRSMAWVLFGFMGQPEEDDEAAASSSFDPRPSGIGGWLWFPILAIVSTLYLTGKNTYEMVPFFASWPAQPTLLAVLVTSAVVLNLMLMAGWGYELYLIARHRARARTFYVALSLLSLGGFIIAAAMSAFYLDVQPERLIQSLAEELTHVIWIPYMLRSRRVRNTLVT